jgi:hypothetical protein
MRRLAALALVPVLLAPAAPAQAADVEHTGAHWTWTGPEAWTDSQATYGIDVQGTNQAVYSLGFLPLQQCTTGATWKKRVTRYFKAKRQQLENQGVTLTNVSEIKTIGNDDYRRQTMNVSTAGRHGIKGVLEIDYDYVGVDSGIDYCYSRQEARTAKKSAYADVKAKLAKVGRTIVYLGNGYRDGE